MLLGIKQVGNKWRQRQATNKEATGPRVPRGYVEVIILPSPP